MNLIIFTDVNKRRKWLYVLTWNEKYGIGRDFVGNGFKKQQVMSVLGVGGSKCEFCEIGHAPVNVITSCYMTEITCFSKFSQR